MKKIITILFLLLSLGSTYGAQKPKLIIYLSIDQMRPDYFERYQKYFTGGLKKLYSQGIVYSRADLNYAASETGPGHATLATGCYPSKSGILGNEWYDHKTYKQMYCVEDSTAGKVEGQGGGVSPRSLMVSTIGDWLKEASPASKVLAISSKDRAAVLMGGFRADYAFWYNRTNGTMVTSDYYCKEFPEWVKQFNASQWIDKNVPAQWSKELPESIYTLIGPDEFISEYKWDGKSSFPHVFTPEKKYDQVQGTPYGDKYLLSFAVEAVKNEKLGKRGSTDLLCLSLSNCDYIGHSYGPDSHEILDQLVKLDRYLDEFFKDVDTYLGEGSVVVALSADHAVCPLPEFLQQNGVKEAKRYIYNDKIKPQTDSLLRALKAEFNVSEDLIIKNSFINYSVGLSSKMDSIALEGRIKTGLLSISPIKDVYFRRELISNSKINKPLIQKYRNSYFAARGEDFQLRFEKFALITSRSTGTSHGSPYEYDTHVPIILWWKGAKAQKIQREVYTVDIAPSLAKISGFSFPKNVDGKPLKEIFQ